MPKKRIGRKLKPGFWSLGFPLLVGVMRFVPRWKLRPGRADQFGLGGNRVAKKSLRIDAFGRVVRTSVNATRRGKLGAKIAGVGFVGGHLLLLDFECGR